VRLEIEGSQLRWARTSERLPLQHVIVFEKTAAP